MSESESKPEELARKAQEALAEYFALWKGLIGPNGATSVVLDAIGLPGILEENGIFHQMLTILECKPEEAMDDLKSIINEASSHGRDIGELSYEVVNLRARLATAEAVVVEGKEYFDFMEVAQHHTFVSRQERDRSERLLKNAKKALGAHQQAETKQEKKG